MYMQAIPGIDNSHREEFQSSSGGTSLFLQFIVVSSRGILLHFYRQSRDLVQSMRIFIYLDRVPSLSTMVGWHNRYSSSHEGTQSSLLFFAHPLTNLHPFHTQGMLLYYSILDVVSLVL